MTKRSLFLFLLFIVALFAGWKYAYQPFTERERLKDEFLAQEKVVAQKLEEKLKQVSFSALLPRSIPKGYYLHAPEVITLGEEKSLRIQYTTIEGSLLDIYERSLQEEENIASPFIKEGFWKEQKELALAGDIPGYLVRGEERDIVVLIDGEERTLTSQIAIVAFARKGTRVVITNSSFLSDTLLSEAALIDFANSFLDDV